MTHSVGPVRCFSALGCAGICAFWAAALWPPALNAQVEVPSASSPPSAGSRPAPVRIAQAGPAAKPAWAELNRAQKQALEPLAGTWAQLSETHKRNWLAVAQKYPTMPPGEQARLHTRMAEWAALSPQQRSRARMNFAETSQLPVDDKKAKWEAYQALSPEEKRRLAAGAATAKPAAPSTAATLQPVPPQKLTNAPKSGKDRPRPRPIRGGSNQVDHNTLLPQSGTPPAKP